MEEEDFLTATLGYNASLAEKRGARCAELFSPLWFF
jgi:hypothetical protein